MPGHNAQLEKKHKPVETDEDLIVDGQRLQGLQTHRESLI